MNYRTCLLTCLLIGIPLTALIYYFGLNYSGFCFAENRYLSDEEKIRAVFNFQNDRTDLLYRVHIEPSSNKYIKYKNFDEYIQENPNCCKLNPGGPYEIGATSLLERIFGFDSGDVIVINFQVRYLDKNGKQRAEAIRFDNLITNCGLVY